MSFCYNVIGNQPTNEKELVYYDVAKKIAIDEISYVNVALDAPEAVYPPLRSKLSSE